jgi:hypothetical protein
MHAVFPHRITCDPRGTHEERHHPTVRAAGEAERDRFLKLADRLMSSRDPAEQEQIKEELARLTFGD